MEQEDKELLIKEISARLPYGVKVWTRFKDKEVPLSVFSIDVKGWICFWGTDGHLDCLNVTDCRLYLRPMSSMTEEEYDQLYIDSRIKEDSVDILDALANYLDAIDWLNAHHFDYRGLIEKGLALVASKDIYNE